MKRLIFIFPLLMFCLAASAQIQFGYMSYKQILQQLPEYAQATKDLAILKAKYEAEAQKGEASDSFKRACFNWGIGRELYTAPFIWIPATKCNITDGNKCYDKFEVEKILVENKRITGISILNISTGGQLKDMRCFVWQRPTV